MISKKELDFFIKEAPQGIFQGQGASFAVIGKAKTADFDISDQVLGKYSKVIDSLIKKGYIELGEGYENDNDEMFNVIDVSEKGMKALKEKLRKTERAIA